MDYKTLAEAGTEKIVFDKRPTLAYPEGDVVNWYGYKRHNITVAGCKGFIVEPPNPAPGLPWSWCLQWAEAFVPRTPALKLLDRGFHHVHLDIFSTYMNTEGLKKLEKFYALLQSLHFHKKAALIGMSYGGLFSFRWAAEHPETVAVIYADAPLCRLDKVYPDLKVSAALLPFFEECSRKHADAYGVTMEELKEHPLSPINNYQAIAAARIPILAIRSGQDQSVPPESNIDILAARINAAGGNIEVMRRDFYGHHPHGLDDPQPLADFILQYYPEFSF